MKVTLNESSQGIVRTDAIKTATKLRIFLQAHKWKKGCKETGLHHLRRNHSYKLICWYYAPARIEKMLFSLVVKKTFP